MTSLLYSVMTSLALLYMQHFNEYYNSLINDVIITINGDITTINDDIIAIPQQGNWPKNFTQGLLRTIVYAMPAICSPQALMFSPLDGFFHFITEYTESVKQTYGCVNN